jgi:hypothetical protein
MSATSDLDAAVRDALRYFPADFSEEQRLLLREELRLQFDHPGRYVAYVDEWAERDGAPSLTRHVLGTGDTYEEAWEATRSHAQADRVVCEYADDPNAPLAPVLDD